MMVSRCNRTHRAASGLLGIALFASASTAFAAPQLEGILGDHAVLQRNLPIVLRGEATAGETVMVSLAGHSAQVTAGRDGRFQVSLPPLQAGGPYELTVAAPSGATVFQDVLIGDVFLCSGQSNMEMTVSDGQSMIPAAHGPADPQLRLLTVAKRTALTPEAHFAQQPAWTIAGPDSVPNFSAACFYMVQALRQSAGVPMGAIHSSWGGSRISAWMSEPALRAGGLSDEADMLALYARNPAAANRRAATEWETWWRTQTGDASGSEPWQPDAALAWQPVPAMTNFESWGVPALADYNGMIWYQRTVDVTAEQARGLATLAVGQVDDADRTWVNGKAVGGSSLASELRVYALTPGTLKPGRNVITVNADDVYANGGMLGPEASMRLTFADGTSIPLGDGWRYAVARSIAGAAPRVPWGDINGSATLYNAMIAPLGTTRLAGIAWYQGESDTGLPGYEQRLNTLISEWRKRFGTPRTAVGVVQLSGYGARPAEPVESGWGYVRDTQRRVAAADPHVGLAVTHDIGDASDIHPGEKYQVGLRLARAMRAALYGEAIGRAGPEIRDASLGSDGAVTLRFAHVTGAFHARSSADAIGFELCGEGSGSCRWASGRVQGDTVLLPSDGKPVSRVRYAWSDAPDTNLIDEADLPVGTFEIDVR
jgi:sialate O-acetylesterase